MAHTKSPKFYELALRRFPSAMHILTLIPFYTVCVLCLGISAMPGVATFLALDSASSGAVSYVRLFVLGCALALAYLAYGLTLIFVAPLFNFLLRARLRPWRGSYHSNESVKWYVHNGLTYIARFTFLDFITPTPMNSLFYRMMGMKVGRDAQINTTFISDPSLIELGARVTVGGSATIIGHYGVGGILILAPTTVGDDSTIGLRAVVMGGVKIGTKARVMPGSVVLPKTVIGDGETWGGVPAQKIEIPPKAGETRAL